MYSFHVSFRVCLIYMFVYICRVCVFMHINMFLICTTCIHGLIYSTSITETLPQLGSMPGARVTTGSTEIDCPRPLELGGETLKKHYPNMSYVMIERMAEVPVWGYRSRETGQGRTHPEKEKLPRLRVC